MVGMPESADLRTFVHDGRTAVVGGSRGLAVYDNGDLAMRNMVLVVLTELGFRGVRVAEVFGLTPEHLSTLRGNARRHGSTSLVPQRRGRPPKLAAEQGRQAGAWKAGGGAGAGIGRPVGGAE